MMPSELYTVDGNNHFITKRFDRDGEKKIHTQTLAAIYPDAASYERLIAVCRKLHLPEADCQEGSEEWSSTFLPTTPTTTTRTSRL